MVCTPQLVERVEVQIYGSARDRQTCFALTIAADDGPIFDDGDLPAQ